ncbi:MAG: hypothetical protein WCS90_05795 [Bacilli bacterium]
MPKFEVGEAIIYKNGDSYEIGIVKRVCDKKDGEEQDYFVYYHVGDTAARTPENCMNKIRNSCAYEIRRKVEEAY